MNIPYSCMFAQIKFLGVQQLKQSQDKDKTVIISDTSDFERLSLSQENIYHH